MQLANTARTTLVSSIDDNVSTIVLDDESRFPTVTATAITGTVTSTVGNAYALTGAGTLFTSELAVGDTVTWTGMNHRRVVYIIDDTHLILDRPASVSGVALTKREAYYITVASGGGLAREYMLVLNTAGPTFTVARAQDGSTALAFSAGATVEYRVTAGFITQVMEQAVQLAIANLQETHGADMIGVSATGVVAATVRLALEELAAAIAAHIGDTSGAHAASAVSYSPTDLVSTNVQDAIDELVSRISSELAVHMVDGTAHNADAIVFSPYGGISATDVQAAIQQMWDEVEAYVSLSDKVQDVITTTGVEFDPLDDTQLSKAVSYYAAGSDYWSCAGSGASFTLSAPTTLGTAGTPSYAGTGNGTCTAVSAGSASVYETWTLTATNATTFTVVGSVTGALGNATVGTPYVSTYINFTLTAGGTAFVAGDAFTITMTATNTLRKPGEYFEGMCVRFIANAANTSSPSVNVGGLGAKAVSEPHSFTLGANAWVEGTVVELVYTGSGFVMTNIKDYHLLKYEEVNVLAPRVTAANAATPANCLVHTMVPPSQNCIAVANFRCVAVGTGAASVLGDKGLKPYGTATADVTYGGVLYASFSLEASSAGALFPQPGYANDGIDIHIEAAFAPSYIATGTDMGEWVIETTCTGSSVPIRAFTIDTVSNNDDWSFRLVGSIAYIVPYRRVKTRFTPAEGIEDVGTGTAAASLVWGSPARQVTRARGANWYDGEYQ